MTQQQATAGTANKGKSNNKGQRKEQQATASKAGS
jgi:hypothetical protein